MRRMMAGLMALVLCGGIAPMTDYAVIQAYSVSTSEETHAADGLVYRIGNDCMILVGASDPSVTAVHIPAQVEGMDVVFTEAVFRDCTELASITVDMAHKTLVAEDGVLFTKDMGTLLEYPPAKDGAYSIPEETGQIGSSAFRNCMGLTGVTLHENVMLHGQCFQYCENLEEVIGTVRMVQGHDFVGCRKLRSLSIGEGHVSELVFQNMDALEELIFSQDCSFSKLQVIGCPSLTDLTIDGVAYSLHESEVTMEIIGCNSLRTLTMQPDAAVSSEPYRAYVGTIASVSDCAALEEIICRYPGDIQLKDCPVLRTLHRYSSTRHTVISGCDALETVYGLASDIQMQEQCADLGAEFMIVDASGYTIRSQDGLEYTLHSADEGAVWYLISADSAVSSVYIPALIGGIPVSAFESAFHACTAITEFEVSPENAMLCSADGILFSRDMTSLLRFPNLWEGTYTIPDGVTDAENAFKNCKWLTSLTIPDSVTGDMGSFDGCDSLREINGKFYVDSGLDLIHCLRLKNVHLAASDRITDPKFGYLLCDGNTTLEHFTIEENCIMNGEFRFRDCPLLKTLNFTECTANGRLTELRLSDCDVLTSVSLPPVTGEEWASVEISGCGSLRTLKVYGNWWVQKKDDFHPDAVVYAYADNSNIRSLCEQETIPFIPFGDVTADGSLNILDVIGMNKSLLTGEAFPEVGLEASDYDADGAFTLADSLCVLKYTIGL